MDLAQVLLQKLVSPSKEDLSLAVPPESTKMPPIPVLQELIPRNQLQIRCKIIHCFYSLLVFPQQGNNCDYIIPLYPASTSISPSCFEFVDMSKNILNNTGIGVLLMNFLPKIFQNAIKKILGFRAKPYGSFGPIVRFLNTGKKRLKRKMYDLHLLGMKICSMVQRKIIESGFFPSNSPCFQEVEICYWVISVTIYRTTQEDLQEQRWRILIFRSFLFCSLFRVWSFYL